MYGYKSKIKKYNKIIETDFINPNRIEQTIEIVKKEMKVNTGIELSYIEFMYEQSRFIQKRWYFLQILLMILLWFLLEGADNKLYLRRLLGIFAPAFVSLALPELWKNRKYYSTEIENSSYYTLSQIYSARAASLSIVDIFILTIFFISTKLTLKDFILNFIIPLNISSSISLKLLCKENQSQSSTFILFALFSLIYLMIMSNNKLYETVMILCWPYFLAVSVIYLIYCFKKMKLYNSFTIGGVHESIC